mmetsp:Transcript_43658/g.79642  ORF Transcript_43658/g.79642 Transcript_43658/m.79642 type:complete len:546 (+) Transcript_43658:159-1796(+)
MAARFKGVVVLLVVTFSWPATGQYLTDGLSEQQATSCSCNCCVTGESGHGATDFVCLTDAEADCGSSCIDTTTAVVGGEQTQVQESLNTVSYCTDQCVPLEQTIGAQCQSVDLVTTSAVVNQQLGGVGDITTTLQSGSAAGSSGSSTADDDVTVGAAAGVSGSSSGGSGTGVSASAGSAPAPAATAGTSVSTGSSGGSSSGSVAGSTAGAAGTASEGGAAGSDGSSGTGGVGTGNTAAESGASAGAAKAAAATPAAAGTAGGAVVAPAGAPGSATVPTISSPEAIPPNAGSPAAAPSPSLPFPKASAPGPGAQVLRESGLGYAPAPGVVSPAPAPAPAPQPSISASPLAQDLAKLAAARAQANQRIEKWTFDVTKIANQAEAQALAANAKVSQADPVFPPALTGASIAPAPVALIKVQHEEETDQRGTQDSAQWDRWALETDAVSMEAKDTRQRHGLSSLWSYLHPKEEASSVPNLPQVPQYKQRASMSGIHASKNLRAFLGEDYDDTSHAPPGPDPGPEHKHLLTAQARLQPLLRHVAELRSHQ